MLKFQQPRVKSRLAGNGNGNGNGRGIPAGRLDFTYHSPDAAAEDNRPSMSDIDAVLDSGELSHAEFHAWRLIRRYEYSNGRGCYRTTEFLAGKYGASPRVWQLIVAQLRDKDFVAVQHRGRSTTVLRTTVPAWIHVERDKLQTMPTIAVSDAHHRSERCSPSTDARSPNPDPEDRDVAAGAAAPRPSGQHTEGSPSVGTQEAEAAYAGARLREQHEAGGRRLFDSEDDVIDAVLESARAATHRVRSREAVALGVRGLIEEKSLCPGIGSTLHLVGRGKLGDSGRLEALRDKQRIPGELEAKMASLSI